MTGQVAMCWVKVSDIISAEGCGILDLKGLDTWKPVSQVQKAMQKNKRKT